MVHKIGRLLRSPVKFHQPKYVQNHKNRFGSGSNCLSQITGWKTQSRGEKTREFISKTQSAKGSRVSLPSILTALTAFLAGDIACVNPVKISRTVRFF